LGSLHAAITSDVAEDVSKAIQEWPSRLSVLYGVASALEHIHNKIGMIHMDVKPQNILLEWCAGSSESGLLEGILCDFDSATRHHRDATQRRKSTKRLTYGTFDYLSPERFQSSYRSDRSADVWSFGIVMYEMYFRKPIFETRDEDTIRTQIINGEMPSLDEAHDDSRSKRYMEILKPCWEQKPNRRPTSAVLAAQVEQLSKDGHEAARSRQEAARAKEEVEKLKKRTAQLEERLVRAGAESASLKSEMREEQAKLTRELESHSWGSEVEHPVGTSFVVTEARQEVADAQQEAELYKRLHDRLEEKHRAILSEAGAEATSSPGLGGHLPEEGGSAAALKDPTRPLASSQGSDANRSAKRNR